MSPAKRKVRLPESAVRVGAALSCGGERAHTVHFAREFAQDEPVGDVLDPDYVLVGVEPAEGLEPVRAASDTSGQNPDTSPTNLPQSLAPQHGCDKALTASNQQKPAPSGQFQHPSAQPKCALCVHKSGGGLAADLAEVVRSWAQLPSGVREAILLLVRSGRHG